MANDRTLFTRARTRLSTRRCVACGERYRRRYPYCPVCKTKKGHDGIPKNPNWPAGMG